MMTAMARSEAFANTATASLFAPAGATTAGDTLNSP
jgi:hypothetical protein